jgi:hypothetical protein
MGVRQEVPVALGGGLNLTATAAEIKPGELLQAINVEIDLGKHYKSLSGVESFDGHESPTRTPWWRVPVANVNAYALGETVTGSTSGATGKVAVKHTGDSCLILYGVVGSFANGEVLGGSTITGTVEYKGANNDVQALEFTLLCEDYLRSRILAVPGTGAVRGVAMYAGDIYAWRDKVGGATLGMYKSTVTGWQEIVTGFALAPGGLIKTVTGNAYGGGSTGIKLYGVDGKNKAFSFNGATYSQITTGSEPLFPLNVAFFANHLVLAYAKGGLLISTLGAPEDFTTLATVLGTSDDITALEVQPGGALAIFCRNRTYMLYGKDNTDFDLQSFSETTGARALTVQTLTDAVYLDDRGISALKRSQAFGNFEFGSLSHKIRPLIDRGRDRVAGSVVVRKKNQYRLFFTDGTGLIATFSGGDLLGWTGFDYGARKAYCLCSAEDLAGNERVFMGCNDGFVYELDVGRSFAGDDIEVTMRIAFMHFGKPSMYKRYHRLCIEASAEDVASVRVLPDYEYGSEDLPSAAFEWLDFTGGGGYWDTAIFDETRWSVPFQPRADMVLFGTSTNIGFLFYSRSNSQLSYNIQSLAITLSMVGRTR